MILINIVLCGRFFRSINALNANVFYRIQKDAMSFTLEIQTQMKVDGRSPVAPRLLARYGVPEIPFLFLRQSANRQWKNQKLEARCPMSEARS
jgi:hypothetical protein